MMRILVLAAAALLALAMPAQAQQPFYFGADLSFVNELEDCGRRLARERQARRSHGAVPAARRQPGARAHLGRCGVDEVLGPRRREEDHPPRPPRWACRCCSDFHYSDDWADGDKQIIPKAWAKIATTDALAQTLYQYTYDTLAALDAEGLMPEMVQVGNETNPEMLGQAEWKGRAIDWARNARLFNAGIKAVRDAGAKSKIRPKVMLHIAQPENVEPWFAAAAAGRRHRFRHDRHQLLPEMVEVHARRPRRGDQPPQPPLQCRDRVGRDGLSVDHGLRRRLAQRAGRRHADPPATAPRPKARRNISPTSPSSSSPMAASASSTGSPPGFRRNARRAGAPDRAGRTPPSSISATPTKCCPPSIS